MLGRVYSGAGFEVDVFRKVGFFFWFGVLVRLFLIVSGIRENVDGFL